MILFRRTPVLLALMFFVGLAACRPKNTVAPVDLEDPAATASRLEKYLRRHPDDNDARRDLAHLRWLHLGQADAAVTHLDLLAKRGDTGARLSRLIIARARHEVDVVWEHAAALIVARTRDDSAFMTAAAELSAQTLSTVHGDRSGDDDAYIRFFNELDRDRLPPRVRQPLTSLRASIARRLGKDYARYYGEQGCVQDWEAGPVHGTLGELELSRHKRGPWQVDPEARIVPLSCVVRVWNPTRRAGIRRMRSFVQVPKRTLVLDISGEEAVRVYVDGQLIHRTDRYDRYPTRRTRLALEVQPGTHELEVMTAIPGERAWVLLRATDRAGKPLPTTRAAKGSVATSGKLDPRPIRSPWPKETGPFAGELYAPVRHYLAVDSALIYGDGDLAERRVSALSDTSRFGEAHLLRARFERADPSRGASISAAREQSALERALELDPKLDGARLRLLEIMMGRGEHSEVAKALGDAPDSTLRGIRGQLLRFRVHRARGSEHLAERALKRAEKFNPKNCRVLMARRSLARELDDVGREDKLAKVLASCAGTLSLRASLAETRGRTSEAVALWTEALRRQPDDLDAIEGLARAAVVKGDYERARAQLQEVLVLNPQRVGAHLGLADLAAAQGKSDVARAQLTDALEKLPWSTALREAAEALGIPDDLQEFRVDGSDALRSYRKAGAKYEGVSEVLILDRSVARVYEGGGQRQIVHLVVHLLTKEALDRYGEVSIPDGGRLLTLHSIKPDGSVLEPERIPGKDGLSLRDLEVDDVVEYEFIVDRPPSGPLPGYVDVSSFRFQSLDTPYHRSELIVVHPRGIDLKVDERRSPPVATLSRAKGAKGAKGAKALLVRHFKAEEVPRLGVEPGHRALLDELPSVRVYTPLDVNAWLQNLALRLRPAQRSNPELRRVARRLVKGKKTKLAKLEALWGWVVEKIEESGDLSVPATRTLASRTGNRLMLLRAFLNEVGIDSELWLARDGYGAKRLPGGHPLVETYDAAMLAVPLPGREEPLIVMTTSRVMPIGYLAPGYTGTSALRVQLDPREAPPGEVKLPPRSKALADRRTLEIEFSLDRSGAGKVSGTIALTGMEAVLWRQALREVDRDRIEEIFQQAELAWLRGATISELKVRNEKALGLPLLLEFTATAQGIGVEQGGALVLRTSPMPLNPSARYTALPQRVTGIVVPYAPEYAATITYKLRDAAFTDVPQADTIESRFGRFERRLKRGGKGKSSVTYEYRSTLKTGIVEATAYGDLAAFAQKVETAAAALLRAKPK